jgi:5-methylcytosine-specific restriction endonuclease McrA
MRKGSRHIPVHVARAVYERDGGCCAWVGPDGVRCGERHFLQLHHLEPWAVGGKATVENIMLTCRLRNQHEARVYFARPAARIPRSSPVASEAHGALP